MHQIPECSHSFFSSFIWGMLSVWVSVKILQNSQENTCVGASFQSACSPLIFKNETPTQVVSEHHFYRAPPDHYFWDFKEPNFY